MSSQPTRGLLLPCAALSSAAAWQRLEQLKLAFGSSQGSLSPKTPLREGRWGQDVLLDKASRANCVAKGHILMVCSRALGDRRTRRGELQVLLVLPCSVKPAGDKGEGSSFSYPQALHQDGPTEGAKEGFSSPLASTSVLNPPALGGGSASSEFHSPPR